jgi:carbon monoxide dehydrogenase subunit G
MKMKLADKFTIKKNPDLVYRFLVDPQCFGEALPDLQALEILSPTSFKAVFRVGISFIRGPIEVHFELIDSDPGKKARYRGKGTGMGSFIELEAGFLLAESSEGTEVAWNGVAQIGGRLAAAAGGLLQPVAQKNAGVFIAALKKEIERTA